MADLENVTDSTTGGTTSEGTLAASNDQSGATDAGAKTAPEGFDEAFLKTLETADPTRFPDPVRQKIEAPFKADYTRKTQELAEQRKQFELERKTLFETAHKLMEANAAKSGPSAEDQKIAELTQLAAAGDADALRQLTQMEAQKIIAPLQTQMALRGAIETAVAANPRVKEEWSQINATIEANPRLKAIASANNYQNADMVLIALAQERELLDLRVRYGAASKELETAKAKAASLEKERIKSLPSTTSNAGTASGAPAPGESKGFMDSAFRAWVAGGNRPEDFV